MATEKPTRLTETHNSDEPLKIGDLTVKYLPNAGAIRQMYDELQEQGAALHNIMDGGISELITPDNQIPADLDQSFVTYVDGKKIRPARIIPDKQNVLCTMSAVGCDTGIAVYTTADGKEGYKIFHWLISQANETRRIRPVMQGTDEGLTVISGIVGGASEQEDLDRFTPDRDEMYSSLHIKLIPPEGKRSFSCILIWEDEGPTLYCGYEEST